MTFKFHFSIYCVSCIFYSRPDSFFQAWHSIACLKAFCVEKEKYKCFNYIQFTGYLSILYTYQRLEYNHTGISRCWLVAENYLPFSRFLLPTKRIAKSNFNVTLNL